MPLAGVVARVPVTTMGEVDVSPSSMTLSFASPWKVRLPRVSAPVPPSPWAITLVALSATVTAPTVAVPSSVPLVTVMALVTAVELFCANLAPVPSRVMPEEELMSPAPPSFRVPPVTVVAPE